MEEVCILRAQWGPGEETRGTVRPLLVPPPFAGVCPIPELTFQCGEQIGAEYMSNKKVFGLREQGKGNQVLAG